MNKNILLIGASGGLGRHFAEGFAAAGYNLALHCKDHSAEVEKLKSDIAGSGIKAATYKADITSEAEVSAMIKQVNADFGSIDVLVNNAGLSINSVSWKMDIDSWNKVLGVNLTGPFLCIKHVLPLMRANNFGRIINISSVVAYLGVPGTVAYAVSKAGLDGLTKTVSKETAKQNITINNISLGYFNAGLLFQIPEELRNQIKDTIPKKEFGDPKEIVNCMLYLTGENSGYITGQTININGGLY
jgi:NAD(P)-dependent dehydrogenase (short-subunit alcohol dehydrogenase family)